MMCSDENCSFLANRDISILPGVKTGNGNEATLSFESSKCLISAEKIPRQVEGMTYAGSSLASQPHFFFFCEGGEKKNVW